MRMIKCRWFQLVVLSVKDLSVFSLGDCTVLYVCQTGKSADFSPTPRSQRTLLRIGGISWPPHSQSKVHTHPGTWAPHDHYAAGFWLPTSKDKGYPWPRRCQSRVHT